MIGRLFALVDCNNFYVSCERLFRPELRGRPVVVLSNNDGCVISRSAESKALGIKMGVPTFQIRDLIRKHGVVTFSSNYALYADISSRVMQTLESQAPKVEVYSIDEAFLDLTGIQKYSLEDLGRRIKHRVYQHTGIPVCVGIAPTKTLAKLANYAAKKYPGTGGVLDLTDPARQRRLMAITPVSEVWGIGSSLCEHLRGMGIETALQFADSDSKTLRQRFSVVVERTQRELNGESCLALEDRPPPKKQILCSRSFGETVTDKAIMQQRISGYIARAAEKLRAEKLLCGYLQVFIRTSLFQQDVPQYSNAGSIRFNLPTSDTRLLAKSALGILDQIWKDGYRYAKAGVMMTDLSSPDLQQRPAAAAAAP